MADAVATSTPSWDALLLVCRQCRKRRNGPVGIKAKDLAISLRAATRSNGLKARALLTTCQGLCPKRATAVTTVVGKDSRASVFVVKSKRDAEEIAARCC